MIPSRCRNVLLMEISLLERCDDDWGIKKSALPNHGTRMKGLGEIERMGGSEHGVCERNMAKRSLLKVTLLLAMLAPLGEP